jgi:ISXO2-like transposase domain
MKRWSLGTYHGLRRTHVDTYLNEFVFRYNRRFHRHVSFEALLGLAAHHAPASYWDIVKRDNPRKGVQTIRRTPRRRKTATGMRQDRAPPAFGAGQNQPIKPVHTLHRTSLGQRDKPSRHRLELELQVAATKWRSRKAIAKQGSRRANRVH